MDVILTLQRRPSHKEATVGEILQGSVRICYSLEDVVRERAGEPVSAWKVPHKTAIPSGVYRVTLETSPRFGPDTLTVNDVPGFAGVRMHAGNTSEDTEGCPLLGDAVTDCQIVGGTSRPAVARVKELVRAALDRGDMVWLDVRNAPPGAAVA